MKAIFVHLGISPAEHLWANLRYFNKNFPEITVVVILNEERHLEHLNKLKVEIHWYKTTGAVNSEMKRLEHNLEFRDGFWRFSIERLFALDDWHQSHTSESFLHIESDILLTSDFPWNQFKNLDTLAWLRYNASHDCAAILYSPLSTETEWLSKQLSSRLEMNRALNDMTVLSQISQEYPCRVLILPGLSDAWNLPTLETEGRDVSRLSESFDRFEGIFDALSIGMWLTGQDPRNHLGWIKRYLDLPDSTVNPSGFEYSVGENGSIIVTRNGISTHLYNLHLHSKQISFFGNLGRRRLSFDIHSSRRRWFPARLSTRTLFAIVSNYLMKNRLFSKDSLRNLKAFLVSRHS